MSNLIPTPRTDKNGRVTIRHMRPEAIAVSPSLAASAPSLGATGSTSMTDAQFLRYLSPDVQEYHEHQEYQDAVQKIAEHSPTVIEDTVALLKLGNEHGSKAVRELLEENLETIVFQWQQNKIVADRVDGYDHACSFKETLSVHWAVGSLRSEVDETFNSLSSGVSQAIEFHRGIKPEESIKDYESDLSYWRAVGTAALIMGYANHEDLTREEIRERRAMVEWLETKEYLGDIIRVSKERGLEDVDSIKVILESDSPASLSSGML